MDGALSSDAQFSIMMEDVMQPTHKISCARFCLPVRSTLLIVFSLACNGAFIQAAAFADAIRNTRDALNTSGLVLDVHVSPSPWHDGRDKFEAKFALDEQTLGDARAQVFGNFTSKLPDPWAVSLSAQTRGSSSQRDPSRTTASAQREAVMVCLVLSMNQS